MKKLMMVVVAMCFVTITYAQQDNNTDYPYVEVRGNASRIVEPDRISVNVVLSESESKGKVTMTMLEKQFATALEQAGVDLKKDVVMTGQSSAADKKRGSFLFKNYSVTLNSAQAVNEFFSALDANEIKTAMVSRAWVSNQKEIINELKSEAVLDAKSTATLLSGSLEQSIGSAIQITDNNYYAPVEEAGFFRAKSMNAMADGVESSPLNEVGFRKVTLTQSVSVRFFLKNR